MGHASAFRSGARRQAKSPRDTTGGHMPRARTHSHLPKLFPRRLVGDRGSAAPDRTIVERRRPSDTSGTPLTAIVMLAYGALVVGVAAYAVWVILRGSDQGAPAIDNWG